MPASPAKALTVLSSGDSDPCSKKSACDAQLDLQALHRVRDRLVQHRTAMINQIRGFLPERGITFAKGAATRCPPSSKKPIRT